MLLAYLRTIILYLVLIVALRLLGKRQIGQMEASEFVVAILVADLAAIPMQDGSLPLLSGLVPILTVVGLELVLSFGMMKSILLRRALCGKPVILIENGKLLQENLRSARITVDELVSHLRQKDILDLTAVRYAILETGGELSVFPYACRQPASAAEAGIVPAEQSLPVTILQDGCVFTQELTRMGKDHSWLREELAKHRARPESTLLLTLDGEGKVVWIGKDPA